MEDIEMDLTSVAAQVWEMEAWIFSAALLLGLLRSSRAQNHVYELLMSFFTPRQINGQTDLWLRNAKLTMPLRAGQIDHSAVSAYSAFGPQNKGAKSAFCRAEKNHIKAQTYECRYSARFQHEAKLCPTLAKNSVSFNS